MLVEPSAIRRDENDTINTVAEARLFGPWLETRKKMLVRLIARARQRYLFNGLLTQGSWALTAGLGAIVLLLVCGTQILDWYWLIVIPLVTLAIGTLLVLRRLPKNYKIAQIIDKRLDLHDAVSTAYYFAEQPSKISESIRLAQFREADKLCGQFTLEQAIPFRMPRAVYAVAGMFLVASSLFALRYGLERRLDLKQPLASILRDTLGIQSKDAKIQEQKKQVAKKNDFRDAMGMKLDEQGQPLPPNLDAAPENALDTVGTPDTELRTANSPQTKTQKQEEPPGDQIADGEQGEQSEGSDQQASNADNPAPGQKAGSKGQQQDSKSPGEQTQGSNSDQSSLLAKLKDAVTNILNKAKQQSSQNGSQQQSAANKQNAMQQQKKSGASQQQSKAGEGQPNGQQSDSQDGQSGEQAQNSQNAQSKGAGQSNDQQSSKQPGSGIGKQDGAKDTKLAEQLAAMGKISEIIGKRNQNVTGEVTVEVQSSSQTLKTAYTRKNAAHAESSAEISRDEVPVALQPYVQSYFEQVRKQDAAKPILKD